MRRAVYFLSLIFVSGCTTSQKNLDEVVDHHVLERAPFDLNCPKEKIKMVRINAKTRGVMGCQKRLTYIASPGCNTGVMPGYEAQACSVILDKSDNK
jgi:hypothetical protein